MTIALGQGSEKVDVLTQHNDLDRTGSNLRETVLTPASVASGRFGMIFEYRVDDQLYTQPLVATGVEIGGGRHDVVYATTVSNSVYAFDANDAGSGKPLWHVNFGAPADLHDADFGCTDINGNMGIIGTPVINGEKTALYVVSLTKSGGKFEQRLHKLDLATGADLPGSPVTIEAPQFDALMQNQRPALLLANGTVYIGYASHCDKEPYHGFLLAYDAESLRQTAVFNASPGGEGASIWQSGQAPAADAQGNLYVVTGNGSWNGTTQFSESFLKLDPQLHLLDWFTPTNHEQLDKDDNDLNSSGATLIPGTNLVLGGGKEGKMYLLDKDKLGHLGDEHALQHFQATGSHLHSIVYWKSAKNGELLYLWGQRDRARVYRFATSEPGKPELLDPAPFLTRPEINEGHPGAMVSLSANGGRDGILWAAIHATGDSWHESRPGVLHAYDADDIRHELWNSLQNRARDNCEEYSKMAPPTIANGKVYLASFGTENTGTGQMCVYGLLPNGRPPAAPEKVEAAIRGRFVDVSWTPVPGAVSYRLEKMQGGAYRTIAWGLTQPAFTEAAAEKGSVSYRVSAVDANGVGQASAAATVTIRVAPVARMVMH
jgi:outer membrane protein assembly factor BamB